jgi:hypothetical protein
MSFELDEIPGPLPSSWTRGCRCSVVNLQLGPQWARRSGLSRQALANLEDGLLCDD